MKRFSIICTLWILALSFMLCGAWAQTNQSSSDRHPDDVMTARTSSGISEYKQPGDVLVKMSNQSTNVLTSAPSVISSYRDPAIVVERVETWLATIQNWLTGAVTFLAALLAWWGKRGNDRAATLPVLIRAIENFDSAALKANIKADAEDKGVDDALHEAVRENTSVSPSEPKVNPVLPKALEVPPTPPAPPEFKPI